MDISKINIRLTQSYLEMARSIFTGIYHPEGKSIEQIVREEGIDPYAGIIFSMASATIIYSYLALEAFANYQLYNIWKESRNSHKEFENLIKKNPQLAKTLTPKYGDFYKKYGHVDEFSRLKETNLIEVSRRLNAIAKAYGIRRICDANQKLWQQGFCELLKKARHFLVHPFPNPSEFQDVMSMVYGEKLGKWVQIAQEIISYFYVELGHKVPEWIEKNTLFSFKGIEYMGR